MLLSASESANWYLSYVARFRGRVFRYELAGDPEESEMWDFADQLALSGRSVDFLHGLIDFGAAVFMATGPICVSCPFKAACEYEVDAESPVDE